MNVDSLVNDFANLIGDFGNLIDNFGKPMDNFGNLIDNFGNLIDNFGKPMDNFGKPIDNFGNPMDNFGKPIDNFGNPMDNFGKPTNDLAKQTDNLTKPIDDLAKPTDNSPTDNLTKPTDKSLIDIPSELILHTIKDSTFQAILSLRQTCKRFSKIGNGLCLYQITKYGVLCGDIEQGKVVMMENYKNVKNERDIIGGYACSHCFGCEMCDNYDIYSFHAYLPNTFMFLHRGRILEGFTTSYNDRNVTIVQGSTKTKYYRLFNGFGNPIEPDLTIADPSRINRGGMGKVTSVMKNILTLQEKRSLATKEIQTSLIRSDDVLVFEKVGYVGLLKKSLRVEGFEEIELEYDGKLVDVRVRC